MPFNVLGQRGDEFFRRGRGQEFKYRVCPTSGAEIDRQKLPGFLVDLDNLAISPTGQLGIFGFLKQTPPPMAV